MLTLVLARVQKHSLTRELLSLFRFVRNCARGESMSPSLHQVLALFTSFGAQYGHRMYWLNSKRTTSKGKCGAQWCRADSCLLSCSLSPVVERKSKLSWFQSYMPAFVNGKMYTFGTADSAVPCTRDLVLPPYPPAITLCPSPSPAVSTKWLNA